MSQVDLYDFDHTIYQGDVSRDFIFFCYRRNPSLVRFLPSQIYAVFRYVLRTISKTDLKAAVFSFLTGVTDVDTVIDEFWNKHYEKIGDWLQVYRQPKRTSVIVSASPGFLIEPISKKIGIHEVIATDMDKVTGDISGRNCRGGEKVLRLKKRFDITKVQAAYSDDVISDANMLGLARELYLVDRGMVFPLDKENFTNEERSVSKGDITRFIKFIAVGIVNASLGVAFAYFVSNFIDSVEVAFVIGFCASLPLSYLLNSRITFNNSRYTINRFLKYCISYIPNLIIQLLCVFFVSYTYQYGTLLTLVISVIVATPITFIMLLLLPFRDRNYVR